MLTRWIKLLLPAIILQVPVTWNDVSTPTAPVLQYRVERSNDSGAFITIGFVSPPYTPTITFMDPAPVAGSLQAYRVISVGASDPVTSPDVPSAPSKPYTVFSRMVITP